MKIKFSLVATIMALLTPFAFSATNVQDLDWAKKGIEIAAYQLEQTAGKIKSLTDTIAFPRSAQAGQLKLVNAEDWTSGFFPGSLWYAYELTGNKKLAKEARVYTNKLANIQYFKANHDVGFMMYCSYGNALRLVPEKGDKEILINTAKSLSTRFSPKVGLIKSWDHEPKWKYPVIIDNMMNLELLFEASKMSKDKSFEKIAVSHADLTMKNHFRPDMSSYHVLGYDPANGSILTKGTHQGFSDESAWSRGQGWGLYSYTYCFRETNNPKYLERAKAIAAYIMNHPNTPTDLIPYWDYNAPKIPNEPRDASAGALIASGLLELSTLTKDKKYFEYAEKMLKALSGPNYLAKKGENNGFVLMHSVGSIPGKFEVDTPLNYADYYYLEAMVRYLKIKDVNVASLK